jgi:flagellar biosynthetic protein FliO
MSRPRTRSPVLLALLSVLGCPALARAADPSFSAGTLSLAARTVGSLAGVIGLIVLLALLLRRLRESSRPGARSAGLTTLGRLDLGSRREIRLVRAGERTLVLGVTDRRIELLTELERPEEDAGTVGEPPEHQAPVVRILRQLTSSS